MTRYSFEVFDNQGNTIYMGCEGGLALKFEFMGYVVEQFYDEVKL